MEKDERTIKLLKLNVGTRSFRYLNVKIGTQRRILFLGIDVLKETSISLKNMARTHFSLSRSNHCCKVFLPVRLSGVTGNNRDAWFYDLKGLMHVAFHFYTYKEQVVIMRCLFTKWCLLDSEDVLPQDLTISFHELCDESFEPVVLVDSLETASSCSICQSENKTTEIATQTPHVKLVEKCVMVKSEVQNQCQQTVDFNASKSTREETKQQTVYNFFDSLEHVMKRFSRDSMEDIFFYKVYVLFEMFLFLLNDELTLIQTTTTGVFPFHLIVEYANIKKSYRPSATTHNESPELYFQDCLLKLYGKWLGMQFCNFRHAISSQVESFKKILMEENRFLPAPLKLLTGEKLFPLCMVDFLYQWMNNSNMISDSEGEEEFQYSKILLVLELISDNLITGFGHVVYAKLKSMDSM